MRIALCLCAAIGLAGCWPKNDVPLADIPKIATLKSLMDAKATYADPQFKKIKKGPYGEADWPVFADVGRKIEATSTKLHDFSMGGTFDDFANTLGSKATALVAAAEAKDSAAASTALAEMKATCKACHKAWR